MHPTLSAPFPPPPPLDRPSYLLLCSGINQAVGQQGGVMMLLSSADSERDFRGGKKKKMYVQDKKNTYLVRSVQNAEKSQPITAVDRAVECSRIIRVNVGYLCFVFGTSTSYEVLRIFSSGLACLSVRVYQVLNTSY